MSNMRGLTVFISDLRNARARETEERRVNTELAKIRAKFRDAKLSGYDRKKYVCKLLYIEKQIGYLGVTLLLNENHALLHLVVNSIRKDLLDDNELYNCLALHCIANIGGEEMGKALASDVYSLLVSPSFVKKKAALTLLRLYKKHPSILRSEWSDRIVCLLDDRDLGVTLAVVTLITVLAQDHHEQYVMAYDRVVYRLNRCVTDQGYDSGYLYYKIPIPWLQIKLLQFLLLYPSPPVAAIQKLLFDTLGTIISCNDEPAKNSQQSNAQNAVLFQAIHVAIHVRVDVSGLNDIMRLLSKFLISKETNVRYLGLETMSFLARRADLTESMKSQRSLIMHSLNDRDISVRRRGLDLLYSVCDASNAEEIVGDLVNYLRTSEYVMREETVLKIAILVEKYTTTYEWYIDVTLQLLAIAGDHVADEIWQRVVQIVANNETLQEHASRTVIRYMQTPKCHENLVKVASFILGEFGHLIANDQGFLPIEQFSALHSKFNLASSATRAILLTTYIKFVNLFPEIKAEILLVFKQFSDNLDPELQQRACEYLYIVNMQDEALLQVLCEEMPPYSERCSSLISKLYSNEEENLAVRHRFMSSAEREHPSKDDSSQENGKRDRAVANATAPNVFKASTNSSASHLLSANWEPGFQRLIWQDHGILYDDRQFCITVRSTYQGFRGNLILYVKNKSNTDIGSFGITVNSVDELLVCSTNLVSTELLAQSQAEQAFELSCLKFFSAEPHLRISYFAGAPQSIHLKLPITINKFLRPIELVDSAGVLNERDQTDSRDLEVRQQLIILDNEIFEMHRLEKILVGMKWNVSSKKIDDCATIFGDSALHTRDDGIRLVSLNVEILFGKSLINVVLRGSSNDIAKALERSVTSLMTVFLPIARRDNRVMPRN